MWRGERWPSIGVIIPNHARLTELAEAICSVEAQRYEGTLTVYVVYQPRPGIDELNARWPQLVVPIPHEDDHAISSIAGRRNTGLRRSSEDLVAFLDDDDLWHPDKLRVQVECMRASRALASFTDWVNFSPGDSPRWEPSEGNASARVLDDYDLMRSGRSVTSSLLTDGEVARTLLLNERRDWTGLDDYDFKLRLGRQGKMILIPERLTALRIDQAGGSRAQPMLHFARAFDVFVSWGQKQGWTASTWRAFAMRWAVTAIFPHGEPDPIAERQLSAATSKLRPSWLGGLVRWSILKAWRSRRLAPGVRHLLPKRLTE